MPDPLISVVITVYNGEPYLAEAMDSVLRQTWSLVELIVVDDGSTDGTAAIAQSYGERVRYHYQRNQGVCAGQNNGIAMTRGALIAFLDADDLWLPEKLALQMELLQRHPDTTMAFGLLENFHSPELSAERKRELQGHGQVLAGFSSGTLLIWKDRFIQAGLFPAHVRIGGFVEWYARAKDAGLTHVMLDKVVMKRRLHNHNCGVIQKENRGEYLRVLKDSLDRRRKVGHAGS